MDTDIRTPPCSRFHALQKTRPLSGSEMSPLLLATGRGDSFLRVPNAAVETNAEMSEEDPLHQRLRRMKLLIDLRSRFLQRDASNTIKLALSKTLRKNAQCSYQHNDAIQYWNPRTKLWEGGYRVIVETGRNAIIERGRRIIKVPTPWIRPRVTLTEMEQLDIPIESQAQDDITSSTRMDGLNPLVSEVPPSLKKWIQKRLRI